MRHKAGAIGAGFIVCGGRCDDFRYHRLAVTSHQPSKAEPLDEGWASSAQGWLDLIDNPRFEDWYRVPLFNVVTWEKMQ
jgi:hypothetical protein